MAYLISKKGQPFVDFHDFLELGKLPGVKFDILYDNKTACAEFVRYVGKNIFNRNVISKLSLGVNSYHCICAMDQQMLLLSKGMYFCLIC